MYSDTIKIKDMHEFHCMVTVFEYLVGQWGRKGAWASRNDMPMEAKLSEEDFNEGICALVKYDILMSSAEIERQSINAIHIGSRGSCPIWNDIIIN